MQPGKPGTCLRREQAEGVPAGPSSRRDQRTVTSPKKKKKLHVPNIHHHNHHRHLLSPLPTTTTTLNQFCDPLVERSCEMMTESSVRPSAEGVATGAAAAWWRHEQQTVRMALAAVSFHSAQQNTAPHKPKTGARGREVEGQVTHAGLRAQETPPLGAAGHPRGARAAEKSPQPAALPRGRPPNPQPARTGWGVGRGSGLISSPLPHSPSAGCQEEGRGGSKEEKDARHRASSEAGASLAARRASVTPHDRVREQAQRSLQAACRGVTEEEEEEEEATSSSRSSSWWPTFL